MPQVRIMYTDGTRDCVDVDSEESVTASVVDGKVVVFANAPGCEDAELVCDAPLAEVAAVTTTPWTEPDGEIEVEETTIWPATGWSTH